MRQRARFLVPAISSVFFLLFGLALIPYPGLQQDEVLFAMPLYDPASYLGYGRIAHTNWPTMAMTYIGTVKTAVYALVFSVWPPSVWSVRTPMVLAGAATIWLTWLWVETIAGPLAAAITAVLLSTDALFLMTTTFDWGPVALQHLLLMGALVGLARALRTRSPAWFALAFLLAGLGVWDKALFLWPLSGMVIATLCVWPREALRLLRTRYAFVAAAAFLAGALPFIVFNIKKHGATFSSGPRFAVAEILSQVPELQLTFDSTALYGFIVAENAATRKAPRTPVERASVALSAAAGHERRSLLIPGLALALLVAIAFGRSRWRLLTFLAITLIVEWLLMAMTNNAAGAAHHTVLMWPFPLVFAGVAFAEMARRFGRAGAIAAVALAGVLVFGNLRSSNEYLAGLIVNGGDGDWTDAIQRLSDSFPAEFSRPVTAVDWGCGNALVVLHRGRLRVSGKVGLSPDNVLIQHVREREVIAGVNARTEALARSAGLEERVDRLVGDTNGRPVFEVFRFVPAGSQATARASAIGLP